ncbi:MAG: tetraacyldisaccharide 4'-kinase, partial [Candidatus Omnitrophota bacterium]|jgi:tetraacyldisaccharide 4'-kinase
MLVGSDRVKLAAQASSRYGADTLILDDGFQQWRIKKDLEIVTIDATRPFGNRRLLPRGILREPLSALRRADVLVLTKVNLGHDLLAAKKVLTGINPAALLVESTHYPLGFYEMGQPEQLIPPEMVAVRGSLSLCGIGDPNSFELLLHSLGVRPQFCLRFPDHHDYSPEDLKEVVRKSRQEDIGIVITTEKDAVRLANIVPGGFPLKILVLKIELRIVKNEQEFLDRLFKLCAD